MTTTIILAIDIGRYKSVAWIYDRSFRIHTFGTNVGWVHDHAVAAEHTVQAVNYGRRIVEVPTPQTQNRSRRRQATRRDRCGRTPADLMNQGWYRFFRDCVLDLLMPLSWVLGGPRPEDCALRRDGE
jgi:hypothetical protein